MRCHGADISLNHGAVVELTDGVMTGFWYYTTAAGSASKSSEHGFRLKLPTKGERQIVAMLRLAWIEAWLWAIFQNGRPDFVGIEDYAIRAEQGAHYLGEVGGVGRMLCWHSGVRFRLHDPVTLKMFITHDGTAQKDLVEECIAKRWCQDFSQYNGPPPKNAKHKQSRTTSEDLADAYGLAKLIEVEALIRAGRLLLTDLEHDKERQAFIRVTKTYPVSLIGREWIQNPDGSFESSPMAVKARVAGAREKARATGNAKSAAFLSKMLGE